MHRTPEGGLGDLDAVIANGRHWAEQDYVFLNNGDGRLLEALPLGSAFSPSYIVLLADLDLDNRLDAVVVRDQLPAQVYLGAGDGRFSQQGTIADFGRRFAWRGPCRCQQ